MNMLDVKKFIMGLNLIKNTYLNWNFDIKNQMQVEIWYSKFKDMSDDDFKALIEEFTNKNVFPPNSPADILKYVKTYDSVDVAWTKILNIISRSINNQMFQNIMAKEESFLYQFVYSWNIDTVRKDTKGNNCYLYDFGKQFKRDYQRYLDSLKVKKVDNGALIENKDSDKLLLENNTDEIEVENEII